MSEPAAKPSADNPFVEMIRNPAARTYLLVSAGGLVVAAAVLYLFFYSPFGAAVVFIMGAAGLALRWTIGPPGVVVAVAYSLFVPFGLPIDFPRTSGVPESYFQFADLLLTAAVLVHLIGAYRFHTVMRAGMPFDAPPPFVKPGAKPTVRPAEPVRDPELWFLFARVGLFVLAGQMLWLFVTKLKVDFRKDVPLRWHNGFLEELGERYEPGDLPNSLSRFLLTASVMLAVSIGLWLVFWYWRLWTMNRDEAKAACLDQEWTTSRREYNRPEKWRGWMKQKMAGTLPKKGCGVWLLVVGLPLLLATLFVIVLGCMGAYR